jgi:hypothetical protein
VSEAATLTDAVTEVERLQQTGTITQEQDLARSSTYEYHGLATETTVAPFRGWW